jgi:hypothetical protein
MVGTTVLYSCQYGPGMTNPTVQPHQRYNG